MSQRKEVASELSKIHQRINDAALKIHTIPGKIDDAIFQHSVLCQTFLPYRNPGQRAYLATQARQCFPSHTSH